MTSIKDRIIIGVAQLPKHNDATHLRPIVGEDVHSIVHVLYALNKQQLIAFNKHHKATNKDLLYNIHLTKQGHDYLEKLR